MLRCIDSSLPIAIGAVAVGVARVAPRGHASRPAAARRADGMERRPVRPDATTFLTAALALALLVPQAARAQHDEVACPTAIADVQPAPLTVTASMLAAAAAPAGGPARAAQALAGFDIVLVPGPGLAANPDALAAFERAAAQWEALFSDPIVVTIDADFADLANPGIIGQSSSVLLQGPFDLIRDALVADAASEGDDGVVAALPTAAQFAAALPPGFTLSGNVMATKAALKALGFTGLDDGFGVRDATIVFNETFAFDLDASDGVTPGTIDLETVAVHEIGHALGFLSSVDPIDGGIGGVVTPSTLDLYRFARRGGNPANAKRFTRARRSLLPGVDEIFDDVELECRMSTGLFKGDGRQASHWKDDGLTGLSIGIMDPTLASGTTSPITAADRRAFDLIGYDVVPESLCGAAPEPAESCFLPTQPFASSIVIGDHANDARDQIQWRWTKGPATSVADFLDPTSVDTRFELCVYDASGNAQPLRASVIKGGSSCGARPCWRAVGTTGWSYARSASSGVGDGVTQLKLTSGPDGRSQVTLKGKGALVAPPDLPLTLPITVQLVASDGTSRRCWQSTFIDGVTRNDDGQLKAKAP